MFKQLKQSAYLLWASDMVRSLNCTHLLHWSYLMQNKAGPLTSLGSESFSCIDCAVWVFIELTPHEILLWRRVCLSRCTLGQRLNEIDLLRVTYWHFLWTSTVPHGQSSNKYELYFDWSELWIDLRDEIYIFSLSKNFYTKPQRPMQYLRYGFTIQAYL